MIKEKVNLLARYYNFFRYSAESEPASEAGEGGNKEKKNLREYQSIPIVPASLRHAQKYATSSFSGFPFRERLSPGVTYLLFCSQAREK